VIDPERSLILRRLALPDSKAVSMKDAGRVLLRRRAPFRQVYSQRELCAVLPRFARHLVAGDRDRAWVRAWVEAARCAVVVSADNHHRFLGSAELRASGVRVVSIQSGFQTARDLHSLSRLSDESRRGRHRHESTVYDIFLAWGERDIERLREAKISYRFAMSVGSVLDSMHRATVATKLPQCDIAVVLLKPSTFNFPDLQPYRRDQKFSRRMLYEYLCSYCAARGIRPTMVLRASDEESFQAQIGILRGLYPGDFSTSDWRAPLGSYDAVMSAGVTVGDQSSLLVEALGRGRRVLAVNMTDNPSLDFSLEGYWTLRRPSFTEFADRLDGIRAMSDAAWAALSGAASRRLSAYDEACPADGFVQRFVLRLCGGDEPETAAREATRSEK
jgi:hypothetical protein